MKTRIWASAAAGWAVLYVVLYLVVIHRQGNDPAWWYAGVVAAGALGTLPAALTGPGHRQTQALIVALVLFAISALLGLLSVGLLLVPGVVACALATRGADPDPAAPTAPYGTMSR